MATIIPPSDPSSDQLPLLPHSTTEPSAPPSYYAPSAPSPPDRQSTTSSSLSNHSQRSVRFQSPPADPPRSAPDNHSLLPPYSPPQSKTLYKGHASEAAYLAALREWAEEKQMVKIGENTQLEGFYGKESMGEWIGKTPRLREGRGKVREDGGGKGDGKGRRKSGFGEWLGRKRTN
ncbi:hypothetical protein ACLMJK_008599 [Lecanora helva]